MPRRNIEQEENDGSISALERLTAEVGVRKQNNEEFTHTVHVLNNKMGTMEILHGREQITSETHQFSYVQHESIIASVSYKLEALKNVLHQVMYEDRNISRNKSAKNIEA